MARRFMGIKLTNQALKAVLINEELKVTHQETVLFDAEFPEFKATKKLLLENENYITPPTSMWLKAVDKLMEKLKSNEVDFSNISAVSGSALQFGGVYWKKGSENKLQNLNPSKSLHDELASTFSVNCDPVFIDPITISQCKSLEDSVGGPLKIAEITGSRMHQNSLAPQIMKIAQQYSDHYFLTERITMPSSFLCSLFLGKHAPTEVSDASHEGLMNIRSKTWNKNIMKSCDPHLEEKISSLVPSKSDVGYISKYFVKKYGFSSKCKIIAFTGNYSAYMIGTRIGETWLAINLDSNDTIFIWLNEAPVSEIGQVLRNPVDENAYLALLYFINGEQTRERIRNQFANSCWKTFAVKLNSTPKGNTGNFGLYYDAKELYPPLKGDYKYTRDGAPVLQFDKQEQEVRAVIEGQFLARRCHMEAMGIHLGYGTKILATGRGSGSPAILQVIADVFNAPVYTQEPSDFISLGAAYLARQGFQPGVPFQEMSSTLPLPKVVCRPDRSLTYIYDNMLERYKKIVGFIQGKNQNVFKVAQK